MLRELTASEVRVELRRTGEDVQPYDYHLSGSTNEQAMEDARKFSISVQNNLLKSLDWGWCIAVVEATLASFSGRALLSGCSYVSADDFKNSCYYDDLVEEAVADLNMDIKMSLDSLRDNGCLAPSPRNIG